MFRKILAATGVLTFLAFAGVAVTGAPIPLLTNTSGCSEASQLLACLNSLIQTLNGTPGGVQATQTVGLGSNGGIVTVAGINGTNNTINSGSLSNQNSACAPPCLGGTTTLGPGTSAGAPSDFTPVTINAQRGIITWTLLMPAGPSSTSTLTINDSLITAGSVCFAQVWGSQGGVGGINMSPLVINLTPTTGGLYMRLNQNAIQLAITSTVNTSFFCQ